MAEKKEIVESAVQEQDFLSTGIFVLKLKRPLDWEGEHYSELTIDLGSLTGEDMEKVEMELAEEGRIVFDPLYSDAYMFKLAARAAKVHSSVIEHLKLVDAAEIRGRVKRFLTRGE